MLQLALVIAFASSQKWVALVHTSGDVPSSWAKPLQEAAEANKQGAQWALPPQVTLDEAQLALGCAGWNHACAGQIAGMTGAGTALVVDVAAKDAGVVVTVQAVKANGKELGPEEKLELPGKTDKDLEFAKDFVKSSPKEQRAYLVIDSDVPGTDVVLDGNKVGKTRWADSVTPGEHKLMLSADGRAPVQATINAKAGMVTTQAYSMTAAGPPVETSTPVGTGLPPDHELKSNATTPSTPPPASAGPGNGVVGWSLAGGGGALALVGGVIATAAVYDRYYNRVQCGPKGSQQFCVPNSPMLFGIYGSGPAREKFASDSSAWIGGSVAAVGVGVLLIGTGIVLATGSDLAGPTTTTTSVPGAASR
jgi:hypothetical protein